MSTAEKSDRPERDQDLICQSGPSAKDSVIFSGGDFSNNYGADQQRLQISDLHFDKFPTPATFACWKIRFKTEVCTCSQFPYGSDAMDGQGGWGPQGRRETGGGGLARVPNLRVCKHLFTAGVAHAGGEGRINVLPWYRPSRRGNTSSESRRRENRAAQKG